MQRKESRTLWLMVLIVLAVLTLFWVAYSNGPISINWNSFVNELLVQSVSVVLGAVVTIMIYRYAYHRGK